MLEIVDFNVGDGSVADFGVVIVGDLEAASEVVMVVEDISSTPR